ncbi:MAG: prolyl oligopeptidase family serine peptidase [Phycisphaerales bacterium]|jgi:hypothetical protein
MIERFAQFPESLAKQTRRMTLAGVPAIVAHPDWATAAPVMLWMHGRTASKELDPGRYLRWIRAGIAAVALDLPGHGERYDASFQHPRATMDVIAQMSGEIDGVVDALAAPGVGEFLDFSRMGIGGMSAGGMTSLRRLCEGHDFVCAAIEGATGAFEALYFPADASRPPWGVEQDRAKVEALDPSTHLSGFAPLPLLALHCEVDEVVPVGTLRGFLAKLRECYIGAGADPGQIELKTWPETGAPNQHAGFGKFGNDAKNAQVAYLRRRLVGAAGPA